MRALTFFLVLFAGIGLLALRQYPRKLAQVPETLQPIVASPAATDYVAPYSSSTAPAPALEPAIVQADAPPTPPGPHILGEWTGHPPARLWDIARAQARENAPRATRIPLRLSPERTATMQIEDYQPTEEDGGVFIGTVAGDPNSTVVMSYIGNAQAGVVLLPAEHRAFNFRAGDDGILRVTELDTRNAPDCGQPGTPLTPPPLLPPSS